MKDLTDKARANLAAGNHTGAGTPLCRTCEGPKEHTRLNSSACRACGTRSAEQTATATRRVTVNLPVEAWALLNQKAAHAGLPLGTYTRTLLLALLGQHPGATP